MGISTIISTDFVRGVVRPRAPAARRARLTDAPRAGHCNNQLRGNATESSCPLLFASTYQAGDVIAYSGEPNAEPDVVERKRTGALCPRVHAVPLRSRRRVMQ